MFAVVTEEARQPNLCFNGCQRGGRDGVDGRSAGGARARVQRCSGAQHVDGRLRGHDDEVGAFVENLADLVGGEMVVLAAAAEG